jgi:hypothetical protein
MPISPSELGSTDRRDDLDVTEPDLWLEDFDLPRAEEDEALDPAFYDAKTDPGRPIVDAFANTLPDDTRYQPNRSRDEALASFLETVRRVFGKASDAE